MGDAPAGVRSYPSGSVRAPALRLCACLVLIAGVAWWCTARLIDAKGAGTLPSNAPLTVVVGAAPPPPGAGTTAPGAAAVATAPEAARAPAPGTTTTPLAAPAATSTAATTAPVPTLAAGRPPLNEPCFGAAALDPLRPCRNLRLARTVYPLPENAAAAQKREGCRRRFDRDLLRICFWGAPVRSATRTIAIVGDSHASHWRAAMTRVVAAKRWRVISISRAGCPFTAGRPDLPGARRRVQCMEWNRQATAYLQSRRSVTAVFTGAHLGKVIPSAGETPAAARRGGYARAWRRLLEGGVRHIVVFRDTPRISGRTLACVDAAIAQGREPGVTCALPRRYALRPDPMVQAAPRLKGIVQVADLSRFFCDAEFCRPVIGGALVLRDVSHMTTTYSTTLGPYLQHAVDQITRTWTDGRVPGA